MVHSESADKEQHTHKVYSDMLKLFT